MTTFSSVFLSRESDQNALQKQIPIDFMHLNRSADRDSIVLFGFSAKLDLAHQLLAAIVPGYDVHFICFILFADASSLKKVAHTKLTQKSKRIIHT